MAGAGSSGAGASQIRAGLPTKPTSIGRDNPADHRSPRGELVLAEEVLVEIEVSIWGVVVKARILELVGGFGAVVKHHQ